MEAYKWREIFINNNIQLIMKRLFSVIAFATLVAMCLVSCKQNEVKLHSDVGRPYGEATDNMGGDGIVFYVNEGAGYALVCSMNDLKRDRQKDTLRDHMWETDFTWSVFGSDTVMERDTVWCKLTRTFRHFLGTTLIKDSVLPTSIVDEPVEFKRYNYENRDSVVTIYPILRYKATKENGEQVLAGYTSDSVPVLYLGFIGELIPADTVVKNVRVEKFIGDTTWDDDTVVINRQKYAIKVNDKFEKDSAVTIYRPYADTVERRTKTFEFLSAGYSDTNVNMVRKGDRKVMDKGEWLYELDTNWSFSRIGIGEDDPDGAA
ncbi:MAG: hypothetical protein K2O46_03240, partial [Bacteroidales bacterium]|nr:hypothetical protein [Bacteroidales bacterium]